MSSALTEQIETSFRDLEGDPVFGESCWLTCYIGGEPHALRKVAATLEKQGACNLDGFDGGFIYAKVPIATNAASAIECAERVADLCAGFGVILTAIDADTSPEVATSVFKSLYIAP